MSPSAGANVDDSVSALSVSLGVGTWPPPVKISLTVAWDQFNVPERPTYLDVPAVFPEETLVPVPLGLARGSRDGGQLVEGGLLVRGHGGKGVPMLGCRKRW